MGGPAAGLAESDAFLVGDAVGNGKKLVWSDEGSKGRIER